MIEAEKKEEAAILQNIAKKHKNSSHNDTSICPVGFVATKVMGVKNQPIKLELDANIGWNNGPYHIKGWVLNVKGWKGLTSFADIMCTQDPLLFLMLVRRIYFGDERTGGLEYPYYDELKERINTLINNLSPNEKEEYNDKEEKAMKILLEDLPNHAKKRPGYPHFLQWSTKTL